MSYYRLNCLDYREELLFLNISIKINFYFQSTISVNLKLYISTFRVFHHLIKSKYNLKNLTILRILDKIKLKMWYRSQKVKNISKDFHKVCLNI